MAKRKEVILQETLNTPQLWEDAMAKEKLYVVDVHQKWCGPCKAITGMLKRIKNELGDDYLCFAVAEADSIPSLESYRGKCEPVFLFFGCGQLVAYVRGCDAPLLQQTITDTLTHEKKVLEGGAERKVVKDMHETKDEEEKDEDEGSEEEEGEIVAHKQITVALIKPDVVSNGQVDEILEKITEAGIEVLANEERLMSEDEAKSFYQNKADEEYFDELISYVTSGPCRVLVLTKGGSGEGVVDLWRDIIGPFDAAVAKEENPNSLRAIYGTDAKANALHGSSSQDEAARELGFFFPDFEPPTYRAQSAVPSSRSKASARSRKSARAQKRLQRTLAIIRPDALKTHKDAIMEKITEAGFEISMLKEMNLTEEQAKAFYKEHEDQDYFQALVNQMTSGPVLALCLAHTDAIQKWRDMLGPKVPEEAIEQQPDSLRAQFHVEEAPVNMLHGSDSLETAEEELKNMFNVEQTLAVIKPDAMDRKDEIMSKLKEAGFMISCQKDMNLTKEIAGEIYKSKEGAEFYDGLIDHMTSGSTLMMVLSAEDAVTKLRNMIGPADPDQAKESAPDSLRALFAKSVMENAIHSPSTTESAQERIKVLFGDVEFNWDGTFISGGVEETVVTEEAADTEAAEEATEQGGKSETPAAGEEQESQETAETAQEEEAQAPTSGEAEETPATENAEEKPTEEEDKVEEAPPADPSDETPADENTGDGEGESGLDSQRRVRKSSQNPVKNETENITKNDNDSTVEGGGEHGNKEGSRPGSAKNTSRPGSSKSGSRPESANSGSPGNAGSRPGSSNSNGSRPGSAKSGGSNKSDSRPGSAKKESTDNGSRPVSAKSTGSHKSKSESVHENESKPDSAKNDSTPKSGSRPGSSKSVSHNSRPGSSDGAPPQTEKPVEQ